MWSESKFNSLWKCSTMGVVYLLFPPIAHCQCGWMSSSIRQIWVWTASEWHSNNPSTQEEPDSVAGTVTVLWAGQSEVWFSRSSSFFPSPEHPHQLWGSPCGHRGSVPGFKQLGCGADHSLPPIAKVDNEWCHTAIPYILLHGEHKDRCTF
jgi:hypothetical protein